MIMRSLNNYRDRQFVHLVKLKYLYFITLLNFGFIIWWNCHFKVSFT